MQNTMYYNTEQFLLIISSIHLCIRLHSIQTNKNISGNFIALTIIESNYICVIIMIEILSVYLKNFIIVTKDVCNFSDSFAVNASYFFYPLRCFSLLYFG